MKALITLFGLIVFLGVQSQTAFTPGSVVIVRVGVPDSSLPAASSPVFLDEYSANGNLLQTIPLPLSGPAKLTLGGRTITEGVLKRSFNNQYLTLGGYNLEPGISSPSSTNANADRIVAIINAQGEIDLSNRLPIDSLYPNGAFRAVVTNDGSAFWTAGGTQGVRYFLNGNTSTSLISNTVTNLRGLDIQNNQLYINHGAGLVNTRIMQLAIGLPDTPGVTATPLPGLPTSNSAGCDFFFADLSNEVPGVDVLYYADDLAGLRKYSLVDGNWIQNSLTGTGADAYRGLTGIQVSGGVLLYSVFRAGNQATGGGQLAFLSDFSGYNQPMTGVPQTLATAIPNTGFRGIALAPTSITHTTETYVFNGNGLWSNTENWLDGKVPPAVLSPGNRILIVSTAEGRCIMDVAQTVEKGGIFIVQPGTELVVNGNLQLN